MDNHERAETARKNYSAASLAAQGAAVATRLLQEAARRQRHKWMRADTARQSEIEHRAWLCMDAALTEQKRREADARARASAAWEALMAAERAR